MKKNVSDARQCCLQALKEISRGGLADVVLHQGLEGLSALDRRLMTELVYGCVRQQRTLDALITQLGTRPAQQQPPALRFILQIGLYQLHYLSHIPESAVVHTSVELTKVNGIKGLAGVVNAILRQYIRQKSKGEAILKVPDAFIQATGMAQSYPDWIVDVFAQQLDPAETTALCQWMNQPPLLDLRVNPLKTDRQTVIYAMQEAGIEVQVVPHLPQALRVKTHAGAVKDWPGFDQGWWVIQDCSAQVVAHVLDPQPGETIVDACAAPGGKTTHIAELMGDTGKIWACDRTRKRLQRLTENQQRLGFKRIKIRHGDSTDLNLFPPAHVDRVLLDAPCSGLGTLHRHADARWRQSPASVDELVALQQALLQATASWVKPGGVLVYATCTLHPAENEAQIRQFLSTHPDWQLAPQHELSQFDEFATPDGWLKIWPQRHHMDGFFTAKLKRA